jgi:hypothetical protein
LREDEHNVSIGTRTIDVGTKDHHLKVKMLLTVVYDQSI